MCANKQKGKQDALRWLSGSDKRAGGTTWSEFSASVPLRAAVVHVCPCCGPCAGRVSVDVKSVSVPGKNFMSCHLFHNRGCHWHQTVPAEFPRHCSGGHSKSNGKKTSRHTYDDGCWPGDQITVGKWTSYRRKWREEERRQENKLMRPRIREQEAFHYNVRAARRESAASLRQ